MLSFVNVSLEKEEFSNLFQLMGKLAYWLGKEATIRLLLDHFEGCCFNKRPGVREACALSMGDICAIIGPEMSQGRMVGNFF